MSTENFSEITMPLSKVIQHVANSCQLQSLGHDVAIPYLAGTPGGGKTSILYDMCKQNNWNLINVHFALKPIEETGGIPTIQKITINGKETLGTEWSIPDLIIKINELSEQHQLVVINLDDSHLLTPIHMAVLYELLTERSMRGFKIAQNAAFTMAGNFGSNKAGAKNMFSGIMNRICLYPIVADFDGWKNNFAIKNNVHRSVISFLQNNIYRKYFHEDEQIDSPWASPRAWTRLSTLITQYEYAFGKYIDSEELLYIATGHVGKSAAGEFNTYYQIYSKFDISSILQSAENYELPEELRDRYALAYSLISYCLGVEKFKTIAKPFAHLVYKFINKQRDLAVMMILDLLHTESYLKRRNLFIDFHTSLEQISENTCEDFLNEITKIKENIGF